MIDLNKQTLKKANKLLNPLPLEIRSLVFFKLFKKFPRKCYANPKYSKYCVIENNENLHKLVLNDLGYSVDLDKFKGRYVYLHQTLENLCNTISKYTKKNMPLYPKTYLLNFIKTGNISAYFSEEEMNQFPNEIINFILKNEPNIEFDTKIEEKLDKAFKKKKLNTLENLLLNTYVSQEIKNDLAIKTIQRYNREIINDLNSFVLNKDMEILALLITFGADIYLIIKELIKYKNVILVRLNANNQYLRDFSLKESSNDKELHELLIDNFAEMDEITNRVNENFNIENTLEDVARELLRANPHLQRRND